MYILQSDIRHDDIRSFPTTELDKWVDITNNWYDSFIRYKGLDVMEAQVPVPGLVLDMLIAKLQLEFAKSKIGGNNATPGENDLWLLLMGIFQKEFNDIVVRINPSVIKGHENTWSNRTVFGSRKGPHGNGLNGFDHWQDEVI